MQDTIEILAKNYRIIYGQQVQHILDEIIVEHALRSEWDEVTLWNRVKIRVRYRIHMESKATNLRYVRAASDTIAPYRPS